MINKTIDCNLVNSFCVDNVTDNHRYRKKVSKTYAEVVSGTPNATDFNDEMKDTMIKKYHIRTKKALI